METKELNQFCLDAVQSLKEMKLSPSIDEITNPVKRKAYLKECSRIHASKAFQNEISHLLNEQRQFIAEKATDMNEILFARATINALTLIRERFKSLEIYFESLEDNE